MFLDFDEVNKLNTEKNNKRKTIIVKDYFEEMELPKEEIEVRKQLALELHGVMLYIFSLVLTMLESENINRDYLVQQLKDRYIEKAKNYINIDNYINDYADMFSKGMIRTTLENIDGIKNEGNFENYYLSNERAVFIAVNESNTIMNYEQYKNFRQNGYRKKQWNSEKDDRVRKTHIEADGSIVDIDDFFVVGNSLMLFPKDNSLGASPEEIVNCRCTVKYIK